MNARRQLPLIPVQGRGDRAPSPAVVERLNTLPMRTVDDVRARFPDVPVKEIQAKQFLNLRVLTTSTCRMRCGYPGEDTMWCHNEGMERNGVAEADPRDMLEVIAHFRREYGIEQVTLAGLQPRLDDALLDFIRSMREDGITTVSLVSHGLGLTPWLEPLRDAGLSDVVLSVQAFDRQAYADIMGVDAYHNALSVIEHSRAIALPIAVNRVVLRGYHHDIPAFLDWASERDLRVRLYDVLWMPGQERQFLANHLSWQEMTHLWADRTDHITVWTYGLPGRINIVFHLRGGGSIETNVNAPKVQHTAPVCHSCTLKDACAEGWLGCGIRISADRKITPCVLRPDLALPLRDGDSLLAGDQLQHYLAGQVDAP